MANKLQIKRTTTSGRTPNVSDPANTQYISAGELALNMADGIMYTSNGSALIEIGSNNTNQYISESFTIGNQKYLQFKTANTQAHSRFIHQSDEHFVFYSTNTTYGDRAIWATYGNSSTAPLQIFVGAEVTGNVNISGSYNINGTKAVGGPLAAFGLSANQTGIVGDGTLTKFNANSASINPESIFVTSNGSVVPGVPGYYSFAGVIRLNVPGASAGNSFSDAYVALYKNGVQQAINIAPNYTPANSTTGRFSQIGVPFDFIVYSNSTNYFDLYVSALLSNTGATYNIGPTGTLCNVKFLRQ